uniref:Phosphatidylinositol 4-phosphate 5-kinase n=1 Tax=Kalanchoe fedtschenkoi TaxID=63787 RepID=A0A7N0RFX6_KALFE
MEVSERFDAKNFMNGDTYEGHFRGTLPHGKGKYSWSDGTAYEGDWEVGRMTGNGRISWSTGGTYVGEFSGGYLHGFGTLNGSDGSVYVGSWRMNVQHGLGKKHYSSSETYEGSWKEGVRDGTGKYSWSDDSTYVGDWKGGRMNGRGFLTLANGDSYDGHWLNGLKHGSGIYKFSDGGYYFGTWSRGFKEGKGTFYPAGSKTPPLKKWYSCIGFKDEQQSLLPDTEYSTSEGSSKSGFHRTLSEMIHVSDNSMSRNRGRISHKTTSLDHNWRVNSSLSEAASCVVSGGSDEETPEDQENGAVVYEREYMQGVLIKEKSRSCSEASGKLQLQNKFCGIEESKRSALDILKSNRSYFLMLNLQLGIRYTVGKITPVPRREVRSSDFGERARIRMFFPRKGSQYTPSHHSISFHWKDYCPMVFRNLREMFKLDAADYMMSICGEDGLRELSSPGKSGSIFYLSLDDRFVIKTLKKYELKVLLRMLPRYYDHVGKHENTLITKFFGVHRITLRGRKKVRFVVMGNMFCTELRIHRRYDLKGSTLGRCTPKDKITENTTLKDLDLAYEFHMDQCLRDELFKQIHLDCEFLESQQIIDYSLLLGLHFRAPKHLKAILEGPETVHDRDGSPTGASSEGEPFIPPHSLLLVTHEPNSATRAPGPHIRGRALRAFSVGGKEVDLLLPETGRVQVQLGVNMPAQANHKVRHESCNDDSSEEVELFEVYNVVLYLGIIDILQEYNLKKKMEHAYKAFKFDPLSISVVPPKIYAKRFIHFLHNKVFPEEGRP